jgi:uncharacterized protein DUF397
MQYSKVGFRGAALTSNVVGVQGTKDRDGGILAVAPTTWTGFIAKIKHGELDH